MDGMFGMYEKSLPKNGEIPDTDIPTVSNILLNDTS